MDEISSDLSTENPTSSMDSSSSSPSTATPSSGQPTQPTQTTPSTPSAEQPAPATEEGLAAEITKALVKDTSGEAPATDPEATGTQPAGEEPAPGAQPDPQANRYAIPPSSSFKLPGGHELRKAFVEKVEMLKQADTQLAQVSQMVSSFRERVSEIGATPEQVTASFGYLQALNSGDYQSALKMLDAERSAIARKLGVRLDGVEFDPLADFPDLQERVDNMQLSEEAALELAQTRLRQRQQDEARQAREQQTEKAQQQFQYREKCHNDMMTWLDQVSKSDVDYPALDEHIARYIEESNFMAEVPPQFWTRNLQVVYNSLKQGLAKQARNASGATPLRSRAPEGAATAEVHQEAGSLGELLTKRFVK